MFFAERYPRYADGFFAVLGVTFLSNYPVMYVRAVVRLSLLYVMFVPEEQELTNQFGQAYVEYLLPVPGFFPGIHL